MFSAIAQWLGLRGPLSAKRIEKSRKLAANPFAQPDVRMREMQRLLQDKSDAALQAVLTRFSVNAQGHIADEEEKRWLCDALVELGAPAAAPVMSYIRTEDRLTHALETLTKVQGPAPAAAFFVQVLREIGPASHRRLEAKLQLVLALADHTGADDVQEALCEHLLDHSDDVRVSVLDVLDAALAAQKLTPAHRGVVDTTSARLATDQGGSRRVAQRAQDLRKKHGFPAAG